MGTSISRRSPALLLPREPLRAPRLAAASELTFTDPAPNELSSHAGAAAYDRARQSHERTGRLISVRA